MEPVQALILFGAVAFGVLVPFVVVPEILKRKGWNLRSRSSRALVWATFLVIVFVPAAISGFLFTVRNVADWAIFVGMMIVAILFDYDRLNPEKVPWARARN